MTETEVVNTGGTAPTFTIRSGSTGPAYSVSGISTVSGPVARPVAAPATQPDESDPVLEWLASGKARDYQHHWVALDPDTGVFRGLADTPRDFRRLEAAGAIVIYVDLPEPGSWTRD
jgi:hypothetical protein